MKQAICKAFCDSVNVSELSGGFGISSTLFPVHGDPAGIYAIGPNAQGRWRIDDGGWVLPAIVAAGFDLSSDNRRSALSEILTSTGLSLDEEELEIFAENVAEPDLPAAAVQFFSALVRVSDLGNWTQERVRSTFREDVKDALGKLLPGVSIEEDAVADDRAGDLRSDLVLRAPGQKPVALYLAQNDVPLLEAMLLRSETSHLDDGPVVGAILEKETSAKRRTRTRAQNRLDVVAVYDGDQQAAVHRIASEIATVRSH